MRNVNKWYINPKNEITQSNAKEFFFDFECNPNNFARDSIYKDWIKLNIPREIIVSWTNEYYEKDIYKYDTMEFANKLSYCKKITGILDQLEKPLVINIAHKYLRLYKSTEIDEIYVIGKRRIAQSMIQFVKGSNSFGNNTITKEKFTGFIPKLLEINEMDLAKNMISAFIVFLKNAPESFYSKGIFSLTFYYDVLMKLNDIFKLNFELIIDQIKPDIPYKCCSD